MDTIKTHYKLSEKQINLLIVIYKFRFVTALLLGQYKGITAQSMKRSLNILEDSGYIESQVYRHNRQVELLPRLEILS